MDFSFSSVLKKCESAGGSIWCDSTGCDAEMESEKMLESGKT